MGALHECEDQSRITVLCVLAYRSINEFQQQGLKYLVRLMRKLHKNFCTKILPTIMILYSSFLFICVFLF